MLGDKDSDPVSQGPTVDWRSLFSKLFLQANWHSMDDFRQCRGAGAGNTQTTATTNRRLRHDYWSEAEAAWLKVEKRLRVAVQETLYVKTDMLAFVQSLEAVLMYFSEKLTALPVHLTPPLLADMIAEPLSVENRVQKASSSKAKKTTKTTPIAIAEATTATATEIASSAIVTAADVTAKVYDIKPAAPAKRCSLKVNIKDSPHAAFYRIFVHATSQFYGFQSRSVNEKSGARVTLITPPTRVTAKNTPMLHAQLSLAAFLAVVTNEAQDVAVVDSSTVASTITTGNLPDISMMMD